MLEFSIALNVVLTACEVPHKVAPIHEIALVGEEETDVLKLCGHLYRHRFTTTVVRNLVTIDTTHPLFVGFGVVVAVHAWEEHVLSVHIMVLMSYDEVRVFLVFGLLFLACIDGSSLVCHGLTHVSFLLKFNLRGVRLAIEQGTVAVLVAAQVASKGKDVLG